jgi:hypothetical protein
MANRLWFNEQGRTLREDGGLSGVALNEDGIPEASMGVVVSDFDNDGHPDLLLTHLQGESNTLYRGMGGGLFEDWTRRGGLAQSSLESTSFGIASLDFDNDGWVDIAVANGAVVLDSSKPRTVAALPLDEPDHLLRNVEGRFVPYPSPAFAVSAVGRGVAVGDLDNDGDPDLVFNDAEGAARVLINDRGQDGAWVGFRVQSEKGLEAGDGVVVLLKSDRGTTAGWRSSQRGGSYFSSNDPRLLFGLGEGGVGDKLLAEVRWLDGTSESFCPFLPGEYHLLRRGSGSATGAE